MSFLKLWGVTKGVKDAKERKDAHRPESIFLVMHIPLNAALSIETGLSYSDVLANYEKYYMS